ncbi:uncharacterized protein LOC106667125 isoform X2 [Cimex lectularius]|uniref:Nucleolus and neural progenitor protein-like N-terminal domain-containing protein n=1 Tax=Cimex lectularius TaxID=79782 RepID=A0A8I6RS11_CIMLE|nr:uncharacterized protein LOC106667125 isoform X2 [Cimex lectularius]
MDPNLFIPFWNRKDLPSPEMISVKLTSNEPYKTSGALSQFLLNIISTLTKYNLQIQKHRAYLKRLAYRMKKVFRNDKGFKLMQMLNKALLNYDTQAFVENIRQVQFCARDDKGPSKQMVQWLSINFQRNSALLYRIYTLIIKSAFFFKERFYSGFHWNVAAIVVAIMSKLWKLSKQIITKISEWNSVLIDFLPELKFVGDKWLPVGHKIHKDLVRWLGNPQELQTIQQPAALDIATNLTSEESTKSEPAKTEIENVTSCLFFNEDVGECLEDNTCKNTQDFLDFLQSEKEKRVADRANAKSKSLTNKQWKKFCQDVKKAVSVLGQLEESSAQYKTVLDSTNKIIDNVIGKENR